MISKKEAEEIQKYYHKTDRKLDCFCSYYNQAGYPMPDCSKKKG